MKREDLLFAIGELDEELIASADEAPRKAPRSRARIGTALGGVLAAALALAILIPGILARFFNDQTAAPDEEMLGGDMIMTYAYITDAGGSVRIEDAAHVDAILAAIENVRATAPSEAIGTPPETEGENVLAHGEYRIFLYTGDRGGGEYRLTETRLYAFGERTVYFPTKEALTALRDLITEKTDRKE